jgi:hypothetical protein
MFNFLNLDYGAKSMEPAMRNSTLYYSASTSLTQLAFEDVLAPVNEKRGSCQREAAEPAGSS